MSTESKYCKLVMVTQANNNKFYEMIYEGGNTFTVNYGRIDSSSVTIQKPIRQWNSVKRKKENKGYKDITHLASVEVKEETTKKIVRKALKNKIVENFLVKMKDYTDGRVDKTYSVKSISVSQAQVDEAQAIITDLVKNSKYTVKHRSERLLELYTVIPRRMTNVRDYLAEELDRRKHYEKHLEDEQDNLDAIAAQVIQNAKDADTLDKHLNADDNGVVEQTILDGMGLHMKEATDHKNIQYILDQLGSKSILGIYEVKKKVEDDKFIDWVLDQDNKETRYLIHGTRCSSVIPILETGLQIRPAGNFQFSGKVYGDGNYFSETAIKSLGYTGYDKDQILLIYEVHTGNPYVYQGWYSGNSFTLSYPELKKRGFDSTHVASGRGKNGGNLLNTEIVAYKEEQARIKYIIHVKR